MSDRYQPDEFEAKWRQRWKDADLFRTTEENGKKKFYGMDFFPYPSGSGLSVGHCRNYVPTDVICRMKKMQGFNVLHPMGFDAFGLPAENEAIKRQRDPAEMIAEYAATYRRQMELVGVSYDWSRSFASCDPDYMRWTQWIFQLLHKRGLAYRRQASVNWDPVDKTVLADEEIVGGRAERSGAVVEKKLIPQWFFRISEYAQRLIDDLDTIDWPEGIKLQQKNWIGRSEGVQFTMRVVLGPVSSESYTPGGPARSAELEELEREVRAGQHEPKPPKSDAELKALGYLHKIDSLVQDSTKARDAGMDLFQASAAKIGAASGPINWKEREPQIEVFTTRIDTVFGVTFCAVAPEHPLIDFLLPQLPLDRQDAIRSYRDAAKSLSSHDRQSEGRDKTGAFTGAFAINPVNSRPVPIWVADYVMMEYGTGALMAVPGHDQRDFDFAVKYGLDVVPVIKPTADYLKKFSTDPFDYDKELARYSNDAKLFSPVFVSKESACFNSSWCDGMGFGDATKKLGEWFEKQGIGARKVQFKLRDWLISRQRYWGCPIPVVHTEEGAIELLPDDQLPVLLPKVENYEPGEDGQSPLARIENWVQTTDSAGRPAMRETDTMGGFADSSWYFMRFCDPHNASQAWSLESDKTWMPVDCYVGGAEHAVMHLLYARFWTKVFYDAGLTHVKEPFQRLENQGQVLASTPYRKPRDGEKLDTGEDGILVSFEEAEALPKEEVFWRWSRMSKSKGNVVTPEEAVEQFGSDALRLYLLFVAPFNADVQWDSNGMQGTSRFLSRIFRLCSKELGMGVAYRPDWRTILAQSEQTTSNDPILRDMRRLTHQTIRKSTDALEKFSFNTYVSSLMIFVNELSGLYNLVAKSDGTFEGVDYDSLPTEGHLPSHFDKTDFWRSENLPVIQAVLSEAIETLVSLLSPGAPHCADELWSSLGKEGFTYDAPWPLFDSALAKEETVTIAIQVNGKLRDTIDMPAGSTKEELEAAALGSAKVKAFVNGSAVKKVIVVPGRLVNVVVG